MSEQRTGPVRGWKVKLTRGLSSLIDEADAPMVERLPWYAQTTPRGGIYAATRGGVLLHRYILGLHSGDGTIVDHVNHDTLDNRRGNLRTCSQAENSRNSRINRRNKSGFKGVSFVAAKGRWAAHICVNYRRMFLGYFDDPAKAHDVYMEAASSYFGRFACPGK